VGKVWLLPETMVSAPGVPVAVSVKVTEAPPSIDARMRCVPLAGPSVYLLLARPLASVVLVAEASVPPPSTTSQRTITPARDLLCGGAAICTTRSCGSSVFTGPVWLLPETMASVGRKAVAWTCTICVVSWPMLARMRTGPALLPNRKPMLARPRPSVVAAIASSVALPDCTMKSTVWPSTGWPLASNTSTMIGWSARVPTGPVWLLPDTRRSEFAPLPATRRWKVVLAPLALARTNTSPLALPKVMPLLAVPSLAVLLEGESSVASPCTTSHVMTASGTGTSS
jgi:hypothetical protein